MVDQGIINIVKQYAKLVSKSYGVKRVYLFGSFARGRAQDASDIDIALVLANMPDFFDAQNQLMRLRRKIDLRIEPHPIQINDFNASNPLANEVERTGVEIEL
jgi:predicted nucleotidyltransferase